jgi:hypothetical protein
MEKKMVIGIVMLVAAAVLAGFVGDASDMNVGGTLVPVDSVAVQR